MRVLLLGPWPPPHGGVQTHLVALRDFLRARHVDTAVINITRHRKPEGDGVFYPENATQLLRLLFTRPYDIIHLHFGGDLTTRLVALSLVCSAIPRTRTVLTFHSGGYPRSAAGRAAASGSIRGLVLRKLDRVIGVNQELVDMFLRFGVRPDRLRLIAPHAFDARSAGDDAERGGWPEHLREFFRAHQPVLLTVGLLEPEYDLSRQIEMLGLLRESLPEAGLAIVGSGSLEHDLRRQIDARPYRDHVLLCGDVPHAATLRAIAQSSLLLRTTLYDGDSIAVREALHAGTPVLATDNGMRPAGVQLILQPGADALSRRVMECLVSPDSTGPKRSGEHDTREENLEAVLRVYEELDAELHGQVPPGRAAR